MSAALSLLFLLSGAAGLFYEAVWSRYLSLFVGHDAYAQVLTLVIFLGGMGVGALLVSRRSARLKDPLVVYAVVEAIIGVFGLLFHDSLFLPVTEWAYRSLFPTLGSPLAVLLFKWLIAALLILPQSILLGATFPLMSAGFLRRFPERPGHTLSILYFSNSLGAAAGVLFAGFVLYGMAGLPGTLAAAAMLNLFVALGAMVAARYSRGAVATVKAVEAVSPSVGPTNGGGLGRLLLTLAFGTAIASFVYEIGWIRMLSLVMGSSTHSFELMLSAFILGLSLGSLWMRRRADRLENPLRALALVQLAMGALALLSLPLYLGSFQWTAALMQATARTEPGYVIFTFVRYLICLAVMLPATFCAGMTLPLMTRMLLVEGAGERAIGTIYAANTLGSIVGAGATGLVLLPLLGLRGALVVGGALDMLLGLLAVAAMLRRGAGRPAARLAFAGAGALAVLAGLMLWRLPWDQGLLSSGVFRVGRIVGAGEREMLYHADGRTATVHATRFRSSGIRVLSTNGKPDGSLTATWFEPCDTTVPRRAFASDDGTQAMLSLLLLVHAPRARTAAVIGHGTGMSSHILLGSPTLEQLTTLEIEPAMVAGSRVFYPANRRAFDDPRSRLVLTDAKAFFAASRERFDIILSEPSNPWVSGVSGLFTTEFYARLRQYLAPGGVFGQWLHTYELSDGLVLSVLAALHENFVDYRVFAINGGDLLVVASNAPLPRPDWSATRLPMIQQDLCRFLPMRDAALERVLVADRAGLRPLLQRIRPNSDFYPVLDLGAESSRFLQQSAVGVANLGNGIVDYIADATLRAGDTDTATTSALLPAPRVKAMLLAAEVRQPAADSGWTDAPGASERYLQRVWEGQIAAGSAGSINWRGWTTDFWTVRRARVGGGPTIDSAFFRKARTFVVQSRGPAAVATAVDFGEALARRDFVAAAAPAAALLAEAKAGRFWIPPDDLLDGSVRALLAAGRVEDARAAYDLVRRYSTRAVGDLRLLLLNSYIEDVRDSGH